MTSQQQQTTELAQFEPLKADITAFVAPVKTLKVVDLQTSADAIDTGKRIVALKKQIEDKRKELVKPFNDTVSTINEYAREISAPLLEGEKHVRLELNRFNSEQELKQAEERRRFLDQKIEADKKAREAIEKLAASNKPADAKVFAEVQIQHATTQRQVAFAEKDLDDQKIKNVRRPWKFEVTDETAIPRVYLSIDEKKIRDAIKFGIHTIPGVRIYQEAEVMLSSRTSVSKAAVNAERATAMFGV